MRNISLDLLKTFVKFASSENMNETAQKLGLSQPAVTFQLKKLEEELPINPFTTSGNRKVLNNFGRALNATLQDRFHDIEVSLTKINNLYASPENYTYKIGGRKEVLSRILPKLNIYGTLEVLSLRDEEIIEHLVHQKIDIGITFQSIERMDIFQKKLFTDHGQLCVHKKWLEGKKLTPALTKNLDFLYGTPAIVYNRRFPYLSEWLSHCGGKVNDVKVRCAYEDWNDIMRMVENGLGYSILPSEIATKSKDVICRELPTDVIKPLTFSAYFHKDLREMGIVSKMFSEF